jgi:hypothetical protein
MTAIQSLPPRMSKSLAAGAAAGGFLIALWYYWDSSHYIGKIYSFPPTFIPALVLFLMASAVWMFGLVAFGLVPWLVLHRNGFRSWIAASVLGFVVPFVVVLGFSSLAYAATTHDGWWAATEAAATLGGAGVVVALAVWLTAYRPWLREDLKSSPARTP